ncbi:helix-turn-helix transcriptional regulator [Nocardioides sp. NPDC101246]|uniref:helix-turn-helix transcriptional regulator n=1 Tax=Nocardioides sp. NPDC101246 TaxID=3364336 RepID=UPI003830C0C2
MSICPPCGKYVYNKVGVHVACRDTLPAGRWAPGVVQRFRETHPGVARQPVAPPVGLDVWNRLAMLTTAEAEVLRLLSCGHDLGDICDIRTVTITTVRTQVKQIRTKLGINGGSYALAVALAWRSGWITIAEQAEEGAA